MPKPKKSQKLIAIALLAPLILLGGSYLFSRSRSGTTSPALYQAAAKGNADEASALITDGADVNFVNPQFGDTPLHAASASGADSVVAALLARGANVNAIAHYAMTPLHYAAKAGHASTAKLLLEKGANPQLKNKLGRTPLEEAQGPLRLKNLSAAERARHAETVAVLQRAASGQK